MAAVVLDRENACDHDGCERQQGEGVPVAVVQAVDHHGGGCKKRQAGNGQFKSGGFVVRYRKRFDALQQFSFSLNVHYVFPSVSFIIVSVLYLNRNTLELIIAEI